MRDCIREKERLILKFRDKHYCGFSLEIFFAYQRKIDRLLVQQELSMGKGLTAAMLT